jgi:hypothetical protein
MNPEPYAIDLSGGRGIFSLFLTARQARLYNAKNFKIEHGKTSGQAFRGRP